MATLASLGVRWPLLDPRERAAWRARRGDDEYLDSMTARVGVTLELRPGRGGKAYPLPARDVRALTRVAVSSSDIASAVGDSFNGPYPEVCVTERAIAGQPR